MSVSIKLIMAVIILFSSTVSLGICWADAVNGKHRYQAEAYQDGLNDMACLVGVKEKCPSKEQLKARYQ